MKIRYLSVALCTFLILNSVCRADTLAVPGSIRFEGGIVERSCRSSLGTDLTLALSTCPAAVRGTVLKVNDVDPLTARADITVKLFADNDQGRYYDRQYRLVDGAGALVQAGNYLITMTLP
ncbi:type 1 fimbrial protein [Pseudomonas sp. C2B4]|uniref:type 1 fimbrial protein n=1 Tax=Pseudomonas sp. C2B4 TaxID=2735270 RepID=UPI001586ECC7|nr:type 1 fimbrial protein [Pseudomonas sp. C2B4]NUU38085.1 type 1 fimbrial protein [Pseudomonas sp. C2B4]